MIALAVATALRETLREPFTTEGMQIPVYVSIGVACAPDHALTAEKLDRFDVLESSLKRLIQIKPDHAHAYNALGYSFAERNLRLPEAKQLIDKALEIAPNDFFIIDSLGWVLYRMGDLKGAAQQLRRAWEGRPDGEIGAHLGEVLWALGERDEARRIWQESLKASPESETLQKTLKRFSP